MKLILDAHVLLWWFAEDSPLSQATLEILETPTNVLLVSAATTWELWIKQKSGKLRVPHDLEEQLALSGCEPLPVNWTHSRVAANLPFHHADPFDRMLIAQAQVEGLTIVSRDRQFSAYQVALLAP